MWGGRFSQKPADLMQAINVSIGFDRRLATQDLAGSRAHAAMLRNSGILTSQDAAAIDGGLAAIEAEIADGSFPFREAFEDIHMNVEARLTELIGPAAGRLHTARSRNDQVALDFRMWVRDACDGVIEQVRALQKALLAQAEAHAGTLMPGFTHLQPAQPVTFGHHLMAYVEMFGRDASRFADARARMNESPLGAAALAGSPFPIDRHATARALGFAGPTANSLDSVSDRDFALETLSAATICSIHLSRLAEEIVLWMTPQFGFVALSDAFTTGSSIMPQKKNPDAAELVRAKVGRLLGAFTQLLLVLPAVTGMMSTLTFDTARITATAPDGFALATDIAEWLVRGGVPFREAHEVAGACVRAAEARGVGLDGLTDDEFVGISVHLTPEVRLVLTVEGALASRRTYGGTAPERVREQLAELRLQHRASAQAWNG